MNHSLVGMEAKMNEGHTLFFNARAIQKLRNRVKCRCKHRQARFRLRRCMWTKLQLEGTKHSMRLRRLKRLISHQGAEKLSVSPGRINIF